MSTFVDLPLDKDPSPVAPPAPHIEIIDTTKTSYVLYTIKYNDCIVKRRYSEFESLRNLLVRLNPTAIIPPIPPKTFKAASNDDVLYRLRMLTVFLNRLIQQFSNSELVRDFLNPNCNWHDMCSGPVFLQVPQNQLLVDPKDPTTASMERLAMPSSISGGVVNDTEQRYKDLHVCMEKIEKYHKRLMKNFRGLAEEEGNPEVGSAHSQLADDMLYSVTDQIQEQTQYTEVVKELLRYKRHKLMQYDIIVKTMGQKKDLSDGTAPVPTLSKIPLLKKYIATEISVDQLQKEIEQLSISRDLSKADNEVIREQIEQELANFDIQMNREVKEIMRSYARNVIHWAKANSEAWNQLKSENSST